MSEACSCRTSIDRDAARRRRSTSPSRRTPSSSRATRSTPVRAGAVDPVGQARRRQRLLHHAARRHADQARQPPEEDRRHGRHRSSTAPPWSWSTRTRPTACSPRCSTRPARPSSATTASSSSAARSSAVVTVELRINSGLASQAGSCYDAAHREAEEPQYHDVHDQTYPRAPDSYALHTTIPASVEPGSPTDAM